MNGVHDAALPCLAAQTILYFIDCRAKTAALDDETIPLEMLQKLWLRMHCQALSVNCVHTHQRRVRISRAVRPYGGATQGYIHAASFILLENDSWFHFAVARTCSIRNTKT
jgi:hypothetical protein